jgi:NaMN:DMB phosphoribosyltransferase
VELKLNKKNLFKLTSIFLSLLLVVMAVLPVEIMAAKEDYNTTEMTTKTNSKKHIESLTKHNTALEEEIKSISKQGFQLEDEYFIIQDVEVLVYSNEEKTIQGLIQIMGDEYTVLEASVNDDGTLDSAFLKDQYNQKISFDVAMDEITIENGDGIVNSAFLKDKDNQNISLDDMINEINLENKDATVNSDFLKDRQNQKISSDIAMDEITLEVDKGLNGGIELYGNSKVETYICSLLVTYSGYSLTTIAKMVLSALGTGPAVLVAVSLLSTLGWAYLGIYC